MLTGRLFTILPEKGLEPLPCCQDGILNPARLPIPPLRLVLLQVSLGWSDDARRYHGMLVVPTPRLEVGAPGANGSIVQRNGSGVKVFDTR